jgi:hypothetical protein
VPLAGKGPSRGSSHRAATDHDHICSTVAH